jgi:hypothetical protein
VPVPPVVVVGAVVVVVVEEEEVVVGVPKAADDVTTDEADTDNAVGTMVDAVGLVVFGIGNETDIGRLFVVPVLADDGELF